jgi:NAD(P)-dependent dehydrogenase (short-subunit alcohol dehydrogenase family)
MAYELEPFGIKVVLVEPGLVRTNMYNNMVAAKKSQDPNSPYSQILQKNVCKLSTYVARWLFS